MKRILSALLLCVPVLGFAQDPDASVRGHAVRLTPRETKSALISEMELTKLDTNTVRLTFDIALPEEYVRRNEACVISPSIVLAMGDEIGMIPLAIAGELFYRVRSDDKAYDFIRYTGDKYLIRYTAEAKGEFAKYEPGYSVRSFRTRIGDDGKYKKKQRQMKELVYFNPMPLKDAPKPAAAASVPVIKTYRLEFNQDPEYDSRGFAPSDRSTVEYLVNKIDSLNRCYNVIVNQITVFCSDAPFGEEKINMDMSRKRMQNVVDEIKTRCPALIEVIFSEYVPENWKGFRELVEASDFENKTSILFDIDYLKNVKLRKLALMKQPNYEEIHALMKKARVCTVEVEYTEMQKEKQL